MNPWGHNSSVCNYILIKCFLLGIYRIREGVNNKNYHQDLVLKITRKNKTIEETNGLGQRKEIVDTNDYFLFIS